MHLFAPVLSQDPVVIFTKLDDNQNIKYIKEKKYCITY